LRNLKTDSIKERVVDACDYLKTIAHNLRILTFGDPALRDHPYSMGRGGRFNRELTDAIDKGYRSRQIEVEEV